MRSRETITSIALVGLAVCAASYAYLVDNRKIFDTERATRRDNVFPSFRVQDVTRIELRHGGELLALVRDTQNATSGWSMASPRREQADGAAVDTLLRELEQAKRLREVAADAGTIPGPRVQGRVVLDSIAYDFALGEDSPRPEGSAYMRLDGDAVFVVSRALKERLLKSADSYRERTLVSCAQGDIARIEVQDPRGPSFTWQRTGTFFRVAGSGLRASRAAVESIFAALAEARADTFLREPFAGGPTATSSSVLTLTPRDPERPAWVLRLDGDCPEQPGEMVVIRESPSRLAACCAETLRLVRASTNASADDSLLFAHADEIAEVELEAIGQDGTRVEIARKDRGWHERWPENRDLNEDETESADALTLALANARAMRTPQVRAATDTAFAVRSRATIHAVGGQPEILELADAIPGRPVAVRRLADDAVLTVAFETARRFVPHPVALHGPAIWHTPFDPASVIAIEDTCDPPAQRLRLQNGRWTLEPSAGFSVDPVAVSELIEAVARARASAWIAESDDGTFGLGTQGSCTIRLSLVGPESGIVPRRQITFGEMVGGDLYAQAGENEIDSTAHMRQGPVFLVPSALRVLGSRPPVDRSRFRLDPERVLKVELSHGNRLAVFVRKGASLMREAPDGARGDSGNAPQSTNVSDALSGLYPTAAIHTGPPARNEGFGSPQLTVRATLQGHAGMATESATIVVGNPEPSGGYFARAAGQDATFTVPRQAVSVLLATLEAADE